jgi:hypothetical protein
MLLSAIGRSTYMENKEKIDFKSPHWIQDYCEKNDLLSQTYEEVDPADIYIELFGSLEKKCTLLLDPDDESKIRVISQKYEDILETVMVRDTVFFYPQFFYSGPTYDPKLQYRKKKENLTGLNCFIVDLDKADINRLPSVIEMVKDLPIQPNYIISTGGGIHLYYVFSAKHDVYNSIKLMIAVNGGNRNGCLKSVYTELKQRLIKSHVCGGVKTDTDDHIVQPMRFFAAKTKNPDLFVKCYKISEKKLSIQDIAEHFDIDLPPEYVIKDHKNMTNKQRKEAKKYKEEKLRIDKEIQENKRLLLIEELKSKPKHYFRNFSYDDLTAKHIERERLDKAFDDIYCNKTVIARDVKVKEVGKLSPSVRTQGVWSQYQQFYSQMLKGGICGNRYKCLLIFWNRSIHHYKINEDRVKDDMGKMVIYFNTLGDTITDKQIQSIYNSPILKYRDIDILRESNISIKFINKKNETRKFNRYNKTLKMESIFNIVNSLNTRLSYRDLSSYLYSYHNIKISKDTLQRYQIYN